MCIALAQTTEDLRTWWEDNTRHVRSLPEPHRSRVIRAKDDRKNFLGSNGR